MYMTFDGEQIRELMLGLEQGLDSKYTQFIIKNRESRIIDKDIILEDMYGLLYDVDSNLPIIMVVC